MLTSVFSGRSACGLFLSCVLSLALSAPAIGQTPPAPKKPAAQAPPPAAPISKHFPILLIASGTEPVWSARIGMKGVERLERAGYPPITLDPGEVEQELAGSVWVYHAQDSAASAIVSLRLTRESCTDGKSDTKYSFRVVLTHAQIGELRGCAKIAPEQFPEFKQKNLDDDDPEKKKIQPPPITGFKPPVLTAYLDSTRKLMLVHGETAKLVAADGYQPSFSHDGKKLLYTQNVAGSSTDRKILLYDVATARTTELLRGAVASAFFSPNDSTIAFLKLVGSDWQVWTMPANAPDKAAQLSSGSVWALHGWLDAHTVLASDSAKLYFLHTEGPPSSIPAADLYSNFEHSSTDPISINPNNPDLLVASALTRDVKPGQPHESQTKLSGVAFLYEIKSKRRVVISPPTVFAQEANWSHDGIQIFFTDNANPKAPSICRIFWDGSGFKRIRSGSSYIVGQ